jgi:hypothetical protein
MAKRSKGRQTPRAVEGPTWWDSLPATKRHIICLGLLFVVSIAFFAPIHFSGMMLIGGDTIGWRAMAQSVLEAREATGEEPLWARNAFGGMPAYMIHYPPVAPQIDGIPTFLRTFIWPTSHLIFLFSGMYFLVWFLTRNELAGVVAAVGYGLTSYLPIILSAGHNTKFIALAFAPWLILAFFYAARRPSLFAGLLFAIALAANFRADHVQITYYTLFAIFVLWIGEGISAYRGKRAGAFLLTTGWLALGSVLALLMVAQPYLAHAEYKEFTIRGGAVPGEAGGLSWDYAMNWSQGVGELLTLLVANAFGGGRHSYWGPKVFTEGPHYVGGVIVLLAVVALVLRRQAIVWPLAATTILAILFSLGENLEWLNRLMFNFFPLFNAFRVPETWLSIVAMLLAILGGIGLFLLLRRDGANEPSEKRDTRNVLMTGGALVVFLLVLLVGRDALFSFEKGGEEQAMLEQVARQYPDISPSDPQVMALIRQEMGRLRTERAELFTTDAIRTLIFLLFAVGFIWLFRRRLIPAWALGGVLVLLVALDLGGVGRRYVNTDALVHATGPEDQIRQFGFDTFLVERAQAAGGPGYFRVLSLEGNPNTTARPSFFHESLSGYHGAKLRLYQDFLDHILFSPETGMPVQNAMDIMNTRYVVARGVLPGMQPVFTDEATGLVVLENPGALDRAFLVGRVEVVEDLQARWRRLRDPSFDPSQTAIVNAPLDLELAEITEASAADVDLVRHTPREISFRINSDATRLLVVSEVYYPAGWHAEVAGERAEILQVNHLLRGVVVPAGDHVVVMRFDPGSHTAGVWISLVSTFLVYGGALMLGILAYRRRRVGASEASSPAE